MCDFVAATASKSYDMSWCTIESDPGIMLFNCYYYLFTYNNTHTNSFFKSFYILTTIISSINLLTKPIFSLLHKISFSITALLCLAMDIYIYECA